MLTAILILVLVGALALALNHTYGMLLQRELRAAADAAAHAGAVSLCATETCWQDAQAAAINTLRNHIVHGNLGDPATPDLDPRQGPVWTDSASNWRVSIERGRWLPGGQFITLEQPHSALAAGAVPLAVAANAVRVGVERPGLSFIATPAWLGGRDHGVNAWATAVKGTPEAGCVAPFAIPVCALYHDEVFAEGDSMTSGDRLFMRTSRFCDTSIPGDPACRRILPEFFYEPSKDPAAAGVIVEAPTCSWNNARLPEVSDHYGVVGLPESYGTVTEAKVRAIIDKTARPCVPARIGERFNILEAGLTESQTDQALWRQISVSYDTSDPSHPQFSLAYQGTQVATKPHGASACPADAGWGACNSHRYVCNGVHGQTYFPEGRFAHGFRPQTTEANVTWPAVDPDTPLWRVQVPVIAPVGSTTLDCPGGTGPTAEDEWVTTSKAYEIIGFLTVNLFDADIGWPPPLNPAEIPDTYGWSTGGSDTVWGLNRARDTNGAGPTCYSAGAASGSAPECAPCDLVRGRVARPTDYIPADQSGPPLTSLVFEGRGSLCSCVNPPDCTRWRWSLPDGRVGEYYDPDSQVAKQLCEEGYSASV